MTAGSFDSHKTYQIDRAKRTGLIPQMLAAMAAMIPFGRVPEPKKPKEPVYDAAGKRRPKLNLGRVSLRTIDFSHRPEVYGKRHHRRWRHKPCLQNGFLCPF